MIPDAVLGVLGPVINGLESTYQNPSVTPQSCAGTTDGCQFIWNNQPVTDPSSIMSFGWSLAQSWDQIMPLSEGAYLLGLYFAVQGSIIVWRVIKKAIGWVRGSGTE